MLWFKHNYSPNEADWTKWDNSPLFAPDESFKKVPPAWIGVAELDILRDEGIAYAEKLSKAGVPVDLKVYKGAPHPIMAMDGTFCLFALEVNTHDRFAMPLLREQGASLNLLLQIRQLTDPLRSVLQVGKQLVTDAVEALAKAFHS